MAEPEEIDPGARMRRWWDARSPGGFVVLASAGALAIAVGRFAPKLWLFAAPPGDFAEWSRARSFLRQCADPLTAAADPACRWRLLPPLVAHALGLSGGTALALPYAGLLAFVLYWVHAAGRLLADRLDAFLLTLVLTTSGAVLTVTGWLGLNDGFYLLGLTALAAGTGWPSLFFSSLLAPWVDERFVLAWPLALLVRAALARSPAPFRRSALWAAAGLAPYVGARLAGAGAGWDHTSVTFVHNAMASLRPSLAYVYLGWWMGWRAGWVLLAAGACGWVRRDPRSGRLGVAAAAAALASVAVLAADFTRSTGLLVPLLLLAAATWRPRGGRTAWLAGLAAANLVMPLLLVSGTNVTPLWSLPVELFRWLRGPGS